MKDIMKNRIGALSIALALSLAAAGTGHAMSSLISLSKDPVWPLTTTPSRDILYNVTTVGRAGSGMLTVTFTAGDLPPGVTVTFSPSSVKFTGNQLSAQTTTMTVSCPQVMPIDSFPFTITATAQRESITITNVVTISPADIAVRPPTLMIDNLSNGSYRIRGLGATGKTYQILATPTLDHPVWTTLGTTTADGNGRFTFWPAPTPNVPMQFFRAVTTSGPLVP
jgi:hypothetical protein